MGIDSKIEWTNHTHNFWEGCHKKSKGCKNCYAEKLFNRWGKDFSVVRKTKGFRNPLKWKDPALVFTCSTSDFFIKDADEWRDEAWAIIKSTPHLTYQILTKHPERVLSHLPSDWGDGYPNVWIGVSTEDTSTFVERYAILCDIPAKVRFLSIEPLIERIPLMVSSEWLSWIVVGAESGDLSGKYKARHCELEWIELIVRRAKQYGVPVFVKQLGTVIAKQLKLKDRKGGDINEWPEHLRIREFPEV